MIWRPKPGQPVRVHYRESLRDATGIHGRAGFVVAVGTGPGPANVLVDLLDWAPVVVPRGNLVAVNAVAVRRYDYTEKRKAVQ